MYDYGLDLTLERSVMATTLLEVREVAALMREVEQVRENHATEADVEERISRAGLNVLLDVAVDSLVSAFLDVVP